MAEYHVGCGAFAIYAGTLEPRNRNLWRNKSECTNESVNAVAQYLLQESKNMKFDYQDKRYKLAVVDCGEWIQNTDDFTSAYRCSCCGYNMPMVAGGAQPPRNFCPNCGADMEQEK